MQTTPPSQFPVTKSLFKHGQYVIELRGCVVKAEFQGVATPSMLRQYHDDIVSLTDKLKGAKWGLIGSIKGTGVLTPEAEESLVDSIKKRIALGMFACAIIADDTDVPALVMRQFERVYQQVAIKYLFCSSEREGLDWLHTNGCEAS